MYFPGKLPVQPENHHLHKATGQIMIQQLFVIQHPFLHPVKQLQQQICDQKDQQIAAGHSISDHMVKPVNKKHAEQSGRQQLLRNPEPELKQNVPPGRGTVFNSLYQLPGSEGLIGKIINAARLFQSHKL